MTIALGPYTFDTQGGADADTFLYTDPVATDATLPQAPNTARRWCHDTNDTTSSNVGPTSGAGGSPDGYLYTEASSPAAFNDVFILELDLTLDAAANTDVTVLWKTNQRGNDNDVTCQLQSNENGAGWVNRGALFGGSGDPDKVLTSGTQIWSQRSVDISALGVVHASTRVRLLLTFPASGTSWHNDYGIDEFEVTGVTVVAVDYEQEGYQFRLDDDDEIDATDLGAQDSDISSVKEVNRRLRILADTTGDAPSQDLQIKYRKVGDPVSEWRDVPLCAPVAAGEPPELADLLAWYDTTDATTVFADDPPTIQAVNNDPLEYIVNKGIDGANSDLSTKSVSAPNDVVLHTGAINGLQTMAALDPADTGAVSLSSPNDMPATPNGVTCAIVCQKRDLQVGIFGMGPAVNNAFSIFGIGGFWSLEAGGCGEKFEALAPVVEDEWIWLYITADSAGNAFWRTSGISEQSDTGNPFDSTAQRIVVQTRHGRVAEVLYYRIALDTAAKADLISYFDAKYGTLPVIGS